MRAILHANEESDIEAIVSDLRNKCEKSDLSPPLSEVIVAQVRAALAPLLEQGQRLATQGSKMHVTREISGADFSIKINFRVNDDRPFLKRLIDTLRGR